MSRICNGCGGVIGRDCFNPVECEWIGSQMDAQDNYRQGYQQAQIDEHNKIMQQDYEDSINPNAPVSELDATLSQVKTLTAQLNQSLLLYNSMTKNIEQLQAENTKYRQALEGIAGTINSREYCISIAKQALK